MGVSHFWPIESTQLQMLHEQSGKGQSGDVNHRPAKDSSDPGQNKHLKSLSICGLPQRLEVEN